MANATQLNTIINFAKTAGAAATVAQGGTLGAGGSQYISTSTTAADIVVPAGHDLVFLIPRVPNPGETVPTIRIGLSGTAHASNLPLSGFFPTCLSLGAEAQAVSLSSTANWNVEVVFGKTETGFTT